MRVLIVEDDEHIRLTLESVIQTFGHEPFVADSVEHGIQMLSVTRPEVILLDLLMNGDVATPFIQVARDLMSAHPPRIIIISAMSGAQNVAERHHVDFLAKPFCIDQLREMIDGKEKAPDSEESRAEG